LSIQNVESLVFLKQKTTDEPAVLFLADSNLSFKSNSDFPEPANLPKRQLLLTAPHHGSKENNNAYKVIDKWMPKLCQSRIYIRSGGQRIKELGVFRDQIKRSCVHCHILKCKRTQCSQYKGQGIKQLITIKSVKSKWIWPPYTGIPC
jgi:hypothetical protein